jgi:hypothetical protein
MAGQPGRPGQNSCSNTSHITLLHLLACLSPTVPPPPCPPTQGLMAGQPGWLGQDCRSNTTHAILLHLLAYLSPMRPHRGQALSGKRCSSLSPPLPAATATASTLAKFLALYEICILKGLKAHVTFNHLAGHHLYLAAFQPSSRIHNHLCCSPQAPMPSPSPPMR